MGKMAAILDLAAILDFWNGLNSLSLFDGVMYKSNLSHLAQ